MRTITTPDGFVDPDVVRAARTYIHTNVCPDVARAIPCPTCPSWFELVDGLAAVNREPGSAKAVRLALHDWACLSGCRGDDRDDHARRTQTKRAAALRKFCQEREANP